MTFYRMPSPLDNLSNLETVPPEKVKAFEEYMSKNVLPGVVKKLLEQRKLNIALRRKPLF